MARLYVKPAPDRVVRDPDRDGEVLASEGKSVPRTTFWLRRISHGDVVEAKPPKAAKADKTTKPASSGADKSTKTEG